MNSFEIAPTKTAAITLRALAAADWQTLLDFEVRNRGWFEQHVASRGEAFYCRAGVEQHIADALTGLAQRRWFPGLLLDQVGAIIGRANLKDVDVHAGVAELGYRIAQDRVGTGLATEAVLLMKDVALRQWGLQRLRAVVSVTNPASSRVLEKCGFVPLEPLPSEPQRASVSPMLSYQCVLGQPGLKPSA